jgi:hypothetical protein
MNPKHELRACKPKDIDNALKELRQLGIKVLDIQRTPRGYLLKCMKPKEASRKCPHAPKETYTIGHDCQPEGYCRICCAMCRAEDRAAKETANADPG